jgi:hypothetical protein
MEEMHSEVRSRLDGKHEKNARFITLLGKTRDMTIKISADGAS